MGFSLKNMFSGIGHGIQKGVSWGTHTAQGFMQMPGKMVGQNVSNVLKGIGLSPTTLLLVGAVVVAVVLINR
jgi:hypothetical protein